MLGLPEVNPALTRFGASVLVFALHRADSRGYVMSASKVEDDADSREREMARLIEIARSSTAAQAHAAKIFRARNKSKPATSADKK